MGIIESRTEMLHHSAIYVERTVIIVKDIQSYPSQQWKKKEKSINKGKNIHVVGWIQREADMNIDNLNFTNYACKRARF
jgi:hypothetical protein